MFGGTGPVLRFVRYMTRAYLLTYGLPLVGLTLWFIVSQQSTLPAGAQTTLIGLGLLIIVLGALFGFGKGFGSVIIGGFAFGLLSVIVGLGSVFNPGR